MSAAEEVEAVARLQAVRLGAEGTPSAARRHLTTGEARRIWAALAPIRERDVQAARREAWEQGRQAGVGDMAAVIGWGTRGAPESERPGTTPNPYRDLAATHDEGGE